MIPAHSELYSRLSDHEAALLWSRLHAASLIPAPPSPDDPPTGIRLASHCQHLSHAQVVLALARETSEEWVGIICKLLRRPMYMCARGESGEPLTDVLGRPLPVPLGHRIGEPVPDYKVPSRIMKRIRRSPRRDMRVITRVTLPNPKRPGTAAWDRYALYRAPMTVSEYLSAGGRMGDVHYDLDHGFIDVALPGVLERRENNEL